jgi:hypothetical protein
MICDIVSQADPKTCIVSLTVTEKGYCQVYTLYCYVIMTWPLCRVCIAFIDSSMLTLSMPTCNAVSADIHSVSDLSFSTAVLPGISLEYAAYRLYAHCLLSAISRKRLTEQHWRLGH